MNELLIVLMVVAASCFTIVAIIPLRWLTEAVLGPRWASWITSGATGAVFAAIGFATAIALMINALQFG